MSKRDWYDHCIEQISSGRLELLDVMYGLGTAKRLFRYACPEGSRKYWGDEPMTGDVFLVHRVTDSLGRERVAHTPALTKAIRADDRIPKTYGEVTVKHLPIFAEWARRLDREFGEETPAHPDDVKNRSVA